MAIAAPKIEPEVEEVLASIRQIMSTEYQIETPKSTSEIIAFPKMRTKTSKVEIKEDDSEVLTLTEMIMTDGSIVSLNRQENKMAAKLEEQKSIMGSQLGKASDEMDLSDDNSLDEYDAKSADHSESLKELIKGATKEEMESIMSPDAVEKSTAAFSELNKLNAQMQQKIEDSSFGGQTIEQLMRELLRPMLKEWLDSHLPSLVKWLVAEKIEQMIKERQDKAS